MPSEAVRVYDIKIEKKVEKYTATVSDEIETTQGDVTIATEGTTTKRAEFEEGATVDLIISEKAGYELS